MFVNETFKACVGDILRYRIKSEVNIENILGDRDFSIAC